MKTIVLLTISNIFMTFAWYGHLKFKHSPLYLVILVSWLLAFFEYCFQVPANRIGHGQFSAAQLKVIQEVITLAVFGVFTAFYLHQPLRWNHYVGFCFILGAVAFMFGFETPASPSSPDEPTASATESPVTPSEHSGRNY